jgi:2,4'-dihydroxyacetophenone dioxygenase
MSSTALPVPAKTYGGQSLPFVALPQKELLTVDANDIPLIEDAVGEGISFVPLRLDLERNEWVVIVTFAPGTGVPLHYHTGPAEVYTLKGCWLYKEYPTQPQTAGCYLYEPGGSVHTLYAPAENTEDTVMLVRVSGSNVNFDDDGQFHSFLDAMTLRHITDTLTAERSLKPGRYIDGGEAGFTVEA